MGSLAALLLALVILLGGCGQPFAIPSGAEKLHEGQMGCVVPFIPDLVREVYKSSGKKIIAFKLIDQRLIGLLYFDKTDQFDHALLKLSDGSIKRYESMEGLTAEYPHPCLLVIEYVSAGKASKPTI